VLISCSSQSMEEARQIKEHLEKEHFRVCTDEKNTFAGSLLYRFLHILCRESIRFYARKQLLLSARISHRNSVCLSVRPSVCLSVTRVDQSKMVQDRITKSSPSVAWKTLVSRTVKLFHKFERSHPERQR